MTATKTKQFRFNVKNLKYALPDSTGSYTASTVKDLAYADSISLEADYDETKIYGDGQVLSILGDDQGKTGTVTVTNLEQGYETDMGRSMMTSAGLADIQQRSSLSHAIYFEVDDLDDGVQKTLKMWLLNCTTGKASESYTQNKDNPTINTYEYPLTVMGTNLLATTGSGDYVDKNGNHVKIYRVISYPGMDGYDTFGDSVPAPKFVAGE